MAQTTAIVTELIFEHALRIRVKAETAEKSEIATKTSSERVNANLLGKINTLVTVDLSKINEMRNVLFLFVLVPIQLVGCVVFLYQVLGWRSVLFPLTADLYTHLKQCFRRYGVRHLLISPELQSLLDAGSLLATLTPLPGYLAKLQSSRRLFYYPYATL